MLGDEAFRLNEHPAGTAARIIDAAFVWLEHFDEHANDGTRRIELTTTLAFSSGKLAEKILVDATENVRRVRSLLVHGDAADEVHQLADHDLVQSWPVIVLRQHALEAGVFRLD